MSMSTRNVASVQMTAMNSTWQTYGVVSRKRVVENSTFHEFNSLHVWRWRNKAIQDVISANTGLQYYIYTALVPGLLKNANQKNFSDERYCGSPALLCSHWIFMTCYSDLKHRLLPEVQTHHFKSLAPLKRTLLCSDVSYNSLL